MAGGSAGGGSAGDAGIPGETCATAPAPITTPILLTAQDLAGFVDDYRWSGQPNCTPFGTFDRDRVYQVTIPAFQRLRATVTPLGMWDPSVQVTDMCLPGQNPMQSCVAGSNSQPAGAAEVLTFLNGSAMPRTVFLVVDTTDTMPTSFDLNIEFLTTQPGDVCATAPVIDAGTLTLQDLGSFGDDYGPGLGCATATGGPDRVYSTVVPPGSRLSAAISASTLPDGGAGFEPSLSFVNTPMCATSPACVASSSAAAGTSTTTLIYDNVGMTPENVFVIVDTTRVVPVGPFQLTTSVAPTMLPPGDVCANTASPITTSTMLTAQPMMGYINHYGMAVEGTTCFFDDGPDRVYAVTVPSGFRLRALGNAAYSYSLDIVQGPASNCQTNPVTCAARQTSFMGGALTATYDNGTGMAQTVFVIVDRPPVTPMVDTFDLGIDLQMIPPYDTCATAGIPITMATTVMSQNLAMAADDYALSAPRCATAPGSPDLVYAVAVPAGQRLTAVATSPTFNPVLNVIGTPACVTGPTQACVAGANLSLGLTETVTWDNIGTTARTVFVVVEAGSGAAAGLFDLAISFSTPPPPPYTPSSITASCQMLTAGALSLPAIGDDVSAPWTALPFTLSYFGMPVTAYSVVSNGNVGFSNLTMGALDNTWTNASIPTAGVPNGMASVLWDDLNVVPMVSTVRSETFGMMGSRRFVVEWRDFIFFGGSTERLTFQLHAIEGTNVIEFHYCSMVANAASPTRVQGDSATIGLENETGTAGVESSFNSVNPQVVTGQGIRFTP